MDLFSVITIAAEETVNQTATSNTFWNATDIIVTIIGCIITAIVTWKAAKANANKKALSYSLKIYPILNKKLQQQDSTSLNDIIITYNNVVLKNPCLVSVEIINTGNKGIENPPILISNREQIEIIPLEIEEVPKGYTWKIESETSESCKISVSLINPKQKLRASFFMSHNPKEPLDFSCAMCDVQCHDISGNIDKKEKGLIKTKISYSVVLGGISIFLLLLLQSSVMIDVKQFFSDEFGVIPVFFDLYVVAIPLVALFFFYSMPKQVNELVVKRRATFIIVAFILFTISTFSLFLILNNILIENPESQVLVAILSVLLYSSTIHLCYLAS